MRKLPTDMTAMIQLDKVSLLLDEEANKSIVFTSLEVVLYAIGELNSSAK